MRFLTKKLGRVEPKISIIVLLVIVSLALFSYAFMAIFRSKLNNGSKIIEIEQGRGKKQIEIREVAVSEEFPQKSRISDLNESLLKEKEKLRLEKDELFSKVSSLEKSLTEKNDQIRFLTGANIRLDANIKEQADGLNTEVDKLKKEKYSLSESIKQEQEKLANTEKTLKKKISELEGELDATKIQNKKLSRMLEKNKREKLVRESANMHYNLGILYTKSSQYKKAIEEFKRAIELNPNDPDMHFNLAVVYDVYENNFVLAAQHYHRCLEISPRFSKKKLIEERITLLELKEAVKINSEFIDAKDHDMPELGVIKSSNLE